MFKTVSKLPRTICLCLCVCLLAGVLFGCNTKTGDKTDGKNGRGSKGGVDVYETVRNKDNYKLDRNKLNIGVYILQKYARTEAHIKDLAECGVDFVVDMEYDKDAYDLLYKYGVGVIESGVYPGWWGGDGNNAGKMSENNPIEKYEERKSHFADHPAVIGVDVGDEPSALDFPHYGKVIDFAEKAHDRIFPYLNLYPNYASVAENTGDQTVSQLGTKTYQEYIDTYVKYVKTDYICYDFYMYSAGIPLAYENLRIVSDACRKTGRSMWIVLQVNSSDPKKWISENQLRFQAYSAMAFGVENITWACYTAGWWSNQVLDSTGEKTQQYDKLKTVNAEIHALADEYMKYFIPRTHFVGFDKNSEDLSKLNQKPVKSITTDVFEDLKEEYSLPLIVGEMMPKDEKDGSRALFICAADNPQDEFRDLLDINFTVRGDKKVTVLRPSGEEQLVPTDGAYHFEMYSNEGVIVIAR